MKLQHSSRFRDSPTLWMSAILVIIYLVLGILGGNLGSLNIEYAYPLVQVNQAVWAGDIWMLFTSMFLHANPLHLGGNILFLLIFGTSLEEQVSTQKWLITYLVSGFAGNIAFLFLGGDAIGLGASGAIWGLLATAGGKKGLIGMIFFVGLDLFSGGGFLAHAGGLVAGLGFRYLWFKKF